jgi:hypothetical protein
LTEGDVGVACEISQVRRAAFAAQVYA